MTFIRGIRAVQLAGALLAAFALAACASNPVADPSQAGYAGAAARYALEVGVEAARRRSWALAAYVRERLAEIAGVRVLDRGPALCAIATAELGGRNAEQAKLALRRRGINTSSPVREDAVIDMDEKRATSAIRISPHYYNTSAEIDRAIAALAEVLETLEPTRPA